MNLRELTEKLNAEKQLKEAPPPQPQAQPVKEQKSTKEPEKKKKDLKPKQDLSNSLKDLELDSKQALEIHNEVFKNVIRFLEFPITITKVFLSYFFVSKAFRNELKQKIWSAIVIPVVYLSYISYILKDFGYLIGMSIGFAILIFIVFGGKFNG